MLLAQPFSWPNFALADKRAQAVGYLLVKLFVGFVQHGSILIAIGQANTKISSNSKFKVTVQGFVISTSDSEEKSTLCWKDFHPHGYMSLRSKR